MKIIVLGLGHFGSSLVTELTRMGHEVIGVDKNMSKVEALKDNATHTVCLDCTDQQAVTNLPLKDSDLVVVAIGEQEGENIMATALMKQLKVKRLISRAVSPLHETVLQTMGVDEIVRPEEEAAERLAKKLNLKGVIDSFDLGGEFNIIEARVPKRYVGKTLMEADIRKNYDVLVLTIIQESEGTNLLGKSKMVRNIRGVVSPKTVINQNDILVMYGNIKDISRLLKEE